MPFQKNSRKKFGFLYNIVYTFQKKIQITRNGLSFLLFPYKSPYYNVTD